ncbi:MAG: hypothetical protein MJ123_08995 [Lachnospiraceae bacterium]|nr:hypothetical protein [Lachnospiraceae bacterium]
MVLAHNITAMNAQRQYNIVGNRTAKSAEKLSSGYKVNRAADDAAALAVSEKMRRQIRGLSQASKNATDGISMVQTAEGGLNEVHDMIHRMNELSVKAANDTMTGEDRSYINSEFQALKKEINRVADTTTFNGIQLFPSDGSSPFQASFDIKINTDGTSTVTMNTDVYSVGEVSAASNATETAKYLASLIPSTLNDIINAYPSLKGAEDLSIKLDLSYIDGGNGTLAYAAYSFYTSDYSPVKTSFLVRVDTADFTDKNALVGGDRNDLLKATLAHELTHTAMQYNLSKAMATEIPDWFAEGSAQMSGGGFSSGWVWDLSHLTSGLTSGDTSKDTEIEAYLKKYTVAGRPYGHGYLATAYASYLAGGRDLDNMSAGLDAIFSGLKAGKSFSDAMKAATGKTAAEIEAAINSGSADAVSFARELSIATGSGAGSSLYGLSLGSQSLGSLPSDASTSPELIPANTIYLQVGSEKGQLIGVNLYSIGTKTLGLENSGVSTFDEASASIENVKNALSVVSGIRSYYGAIQNRLEHTIKNLDNVVENTTAAESRMRDTDMAKEMVDYSMLNILGQAGVAMMSQANQSNQSVLSLLQ